ncbi:hypothetical protein [Streptomyces sp. NPDC058145]|uniref:hypothetical protein n=1 Tax=Streptomyces sp. NPDC058145 TaxID=3346356 RepID=UPI0036EBFE29
MAASLQYSEDWQCFTGFPVVARWSLEQDSPALFEEGSRTGTRHVWGGRTASHCRR